jgi:hypothetical protein
MKALFRILVMCALAVAPILPAFAAATIDQVVQPAQVNVGEQVVVTLVLTGGTVAEINLPSVDGLSVAGTRSSISIALKNGGLWKSIVFNFSLIPARPGDFTIPAFDIHTDEGEVVHVKAMKIHAAGPAPSDTTATTTPPPTTNPNGPVVTLPSTPAAPPANPGTPVFQTSSDSDTSQITPPHEKDGSISKVFILITPQTTSAYVGQAVPMKIEFFIRMDVNADQNSLPTIKGSDFLMNSFTRRGAATVGMLEGQQYERETWYTAISAPKSGDFPLSMERDTYWIKSRSPNAFDPWGGFLNQHNDLAHDMVDSNLLTIHVQPLPTEGQPAGFSGAIGDFDASGDLEPTNVAVGEPFTVTFHVAGEGNFDYVRCPTIAANPACKAYVPTAKTEYRDEARIRAVKTFQQAIIPNTAGVLQLPAATFNYFNPLGKKYITIPITLATVNVSGSTTPAAAIEGPASDNATAAATPTPDEMSPNRVTLGSLYSTLAPAYRSTWFWVVQGLLLALPLVGSAILLLRLRVQPDPGLADRARRERSQQNEQDAMAAAVRENNAPAFFIAARHAVQLQLGSQWSIQPESITLREIRAREPELAALVAPLFAQVDEVIYSGRASSNIDLAEWERRTRELLA